MDLRHVYNFNVIARDFAQKHQGSVVTAAEWNDLVLSLLASNKINSPQLANMADDLTAMAQAITSMVLGAIPVGSIIGAQVVAGTLTADLFAVDSVDTPSIKNEAVILEKCIPSLFTQLLKGSVAYYAGNGVSGTYTATSGSINLEFVLSAEKEHNLLIIPSQNGLLIILRGLNKMLWIGQYAWTTNVELQYRTIVQDSTAHISGLSCFAFAGSWNNSIDNLHFDETVLGQTKLAFTLSWGNLGDSKTYNFGNSIFAI